MRLENTQMIWSYWIVLTYPKDYPFNGAIVKKHLNTFLVWLRANKREKYFWLLEFQNRGAPHLNILIENELELERIKKEWHKVIGSSDKNHLTEGAWIEKIKDTSKTIHYLSTYLNKKKQKEVPENYKNGGRFWGCNVYPKTQYIIFDPESESQFIEIIENLIKHYEEKLSEWSKGKKEAYKLQFKDRGMTMWGCREYVEQLMEGYRANWKGGHTIRSFRGKWR